MAGASKTEEPKANIWKGMLEQASSKSQESKHLIILGDRGCGKSALINQLKSSKKKDRSPLGELALAYTHLDVTGEESEDTLGRLGVWQFEGNEKYGDLLHFALNKDTIDSSLALITLDFSKPWDFLDSLVRWTGILSSAISALKLPPKTFEKLQAQNRINYRRYKDPHLEDSSKTTQEIRELDQDDLPDGVLTNNLGIPIVVVCLKSDAVQNLERENSYRDQEFDFIQYHLRQFCLSYGATLIYSSVNKGLNTQILSKYIVSRLYGTPFKEKPEFVAKDAIFLPAGWDTHEKIKLLGVSGPSFATAQKADVLAAYSQLIRKPHSEKSIEVREVLAEDEQEFLQRHYEGLMKEAVSSEALPQTPEAKSSPSADKAKAAKSKKDPAPAANTEVLTSFFQNLVKKAPNSAKPSPARPGESESTPSAS